MRGLKVAIVYSCCKELIKGEPRDLVAEMAVLSEVNAVAEAILQMGCRTVIIEFGGDLRRFARELKTCGARVVFNLCGGLSGKSSLEKDIASLFELIGMPYTGCDPVTLGLALDKPRSKELFQLHGIPTPSYRVVRALNDAEVNSLAMPLIVKPAQEDASIGIDDASVVRDQFELEKRMNYIFSVYRQAALVEEYIEGREFNVAIVGNGGSEIILPVSEIVFKDYLPGEPKVLCYRSKWMESSDQYARTVPVCPAELDRDLEGRIKQVALRAYQALWCRDLARIDIRLSAQGTPYVLEVNPNPDISPNSGTSRSVAAAGMYYDEFICMLINFALQRCTTYGDKEADRGRPPVYRIDPLKGRGLHSGRDKLRHGLGADLAQQPGA